MGNKGEKILLKATDDKGKRIAPLDKAKVLRLTFKKNLTWSFHLEVGKDAIIMELKKKLGALKFSYRNASMNAKTRLAHRCIISVLLYGIQIWGLYCRPSLMHKAQSVQLNTLK